MIKFRFPCNFIAITAYFSSKHTAIDIPAGVTCKAGKKTNINCYAPCHMSIITNKWADDYGWFIEGKAGDDRGIWTIGLGHFKEQSKIQVGSFVEMGDLIGIIGNTGTSSGSHVHYRLTLNGKRVDPALYTYCYDDSQEVGVKENLNILHFEEIIDIPKITVSNPVLGTKEKEAPTTLDNTKNTTELEISNKKNRCLDLIIKILEYITNLMKGGN